MNATLAQSASNTDVSRIVVVVGVLLVVVLALAVIVLRMRRGLLADEDSSGEALTLHDLRGLHASGSLSDAEFEKAKSALIGGASASRANESDERRSPLRSKPGTVRHSDGL